MSVLSKALRVIVLACLVSGCSISTTTPNVDDTGSIDNAASQSTEQSNLTTSAFQLVGTEQLAALTDGGIGLDLEKGKGFSRLSVASGDQAPAVDVLTLQNPPRLVVDLLGSSSKVNRAYYIENDIYIKSVRIGTHDDRTRVVVDLTQYAGDDLNEISHRVDTREGQVLISLLEPALATEPMPTSMVASVQTEETAPAVQVQEQPAQIVESSTVEPQLTQELAASDTVRINDVRFKKLSDSSGQVSVMLNEKAAFKLSQTAPSEYTLSIPGAVADEQTRLPLLTPKGLPGIRTVRAVQEPEGAVVRMFVDQGVKLVASARDNSILVTPEGTTAAQPEARAQLAEEGVEEEAVGEDDASLEEGFLSADGSKIYSGRLISLDLQDTDIDNALRIIAEVSNLNIIASDEVRGKVTLRLIDVPWDQALDVILKTNGLDQVLEGNVIRIAPVAKLQQEREALKEAKKAADDLEDLQVNYIRVSYARVPDLQEQVEMVLTERGTVSVDERTNQLIVKDIGKGQREASNLVARLDLRTPQVLLETQIVEASRNIIRDLGFQWDAMLAASPEYGNATGLKFPNSVVASGSASDGTNTWVSNFGATIGADAGSAVTAIMGSATGAQALAVRLSALETEGKVRVISRPQVATVNNKEAEIKSVETVRVRLPDSGLSVATGSGANASGGGSSAFEEIDVGIELRMTPQASPDYFVLLDVEANSSTFGTTVVDDIPSTLERRATSTVLVKSGAAFALGGVYRIEDNDRMQGIPFLKDVPVLGHLFRKSLIDKGDEELIFFITPHIVEGSFDEGAMEAASEATS